MSVHKLTYCLGYTHQKCKNCQHEKNWQALNQLPDELRLPMQNDAMRISDDLCRLKNMIAYLPVKESI